MNAWCSDRRVKPCNMLVQMFTLPFNMPIYGREESVFIFVSKPKNHPNQQSWTSNQIQENTSTNQILLSESKWEGWESLFLKEQHQAHLYANAL